MFNVPRQKRVGRRKTEKHPQLKDFLPSCCCCCCLFVCAKFNESQLVSLFLSAFFFGCNNGRATKAQLQRLFFGLRLKAQNCLSRLSTRSFSEMFCGELAKEEGKRTAPPHCSDVNWLFHLSLK
jgi:hypothetical protein